MIESVNNERVKNWTKLQYKKYRDETGLFLIEGEHLVEEAYKAGDRTWEQLQARTKIGTGCGMCKQRAMEKMHEFEHLFGE